MKLTSIRLIWILAILILALALGGCGKDDKKDNGNPVSPGVNTSLVGTWQTQKIIIIPGQLEFTPGDSLFILITVTLKDDNTLTYTQTINGQDTTGTGTWSATSTTATIQLSNGLDMSGTYSLNDDETVLTVHAVLSIDITNDGLDNKIDVPVTIEFGRTD